MAWHRKKSRKAWSVNANQKKARLRLERAKAELSEPPAAFGTDAISKAMKPL